jgi:polyferredoxin
VAAQSNRTRSALTGANIVGPGFLLLAAALAAAAVGWFKRRFWGWMLTVALIATQVFGDLINFLRGDYLRGTAGIIIAGLLLAFLLRPSVRRIFSARPMAP